MPAVWIALAVVGVAVAAGASRKAIGHALAVAEHLGASTGLVGVALVAVGTDLPEIANSISASLAGHGDLNIGDGIGSSLTQLTLVLAVLLLAYPALVRASRDDRPLIVPVGAVTVVALCVLALLILDERLGRLDALVLIGIWLATLAILGRTHGAGRPSTSPRVAAALAPLMGWLALVALAAVVIVRSFVELSETFGVPELLASAVVLALGTSLPELFVDLTAIRQGAATLAIGELFGSSLIDATLAVGIGPLLRPITVSGAGTGAVLVVAIGVVAATWLAGFSGHGARRLAVELLVVYVVCTSGLVLASS